MHWLVALGRDANGQQRWASHSDIAAANAERQLHLNTVQTEGESRHLLTSQQRADAVSALEALKDYPDATLVEAATYYRENCLALKRGKKIAELVDEFIEEQKQLSDNRPTTIIDLRHRLKPIKVRWGNRLACDVSVEDAKQWHREMVSQGKSKAGRKHHLAKASSFFRWAHANGYANKNPFDPKAVKRPSDKRDEEIEFLKVEQVEHTLKVFAKHGLLTYAILDVFLGVRPYETRRLSTKHFMIDGDKIVIRLGADVTKKSFRRVIELPRGEPLGDCVWAWLGGNGTLELRPDKCGRVAPPTGTHKKRFAKKVRPELGYEWTQDILRHTAATYMVKVMSFDDAEKILGHDRRILLNHYRGLTTEAEAKKFYALRPPAA